ncbi:MAG: GTP cyclohydrolase I [Bacteroidota bacterium]
MTTVLLKQTASENASFLTKEEKIEEIALHFSSILNVLGLDLEDESLRDTPMRVAKMYVEEIFSGLNPKLKPKITLFENTSGYKEMLLEKNITFWGLTSRE